MEIVLRQPDAWPDQDTAVQHHWYPNDRPNGYRPIASTEPEDCVGYSFQSDYLQVLKQLRPSIQTHHQALDRLISQHRW